MKKFKYIIAALCVAAIGIGVFLACHKEASEIDKSTSKLTQKDNPIQFEFRALITDETAIACTFIKHNDTVYFSYILCDAEVEDEYCMIVYDPNNEYPITFNEDSSVLYGLNPYNMEFTSWIFRGEPSNPWDPPSPVNPGRVTPGGGTVESGCECAYGSSGHCEKVGYSTQEGTTLYKCERQFGDCKCPEIASFILGDNSIYGVTSSFIVFEANVIYINNQEVQKGDYYSLSY
ncbi:MAG: hypothetical protein PHI52_10345 [Bacteroidales bacterium]|nr:hypothetical protein [Bacteroidales bacterium]